MNTYHFIGIDGPAAAGKTTAAKAVAKILGFVYVDTGAFYRAIAVGFLQNTNHELSLSKISSFLQQHKQPPFHISADWTESGTQMMFLNSKQIPESELRTEIVSSKASEISTIPEIRLYINTLIRTISTCHNVVMEGRDVCTVINPNADCKIFLTASSAVRTMRRYKELRSRNDTENLSLVQVEQDLNIRDYRDTHRKTDPLRSTEDSILIDNSDLTPKETVDAILTAVHQKI